MVDYDNGSWDNCVEKIAGCIAKGHHLKRNIYLKIMSIGLNNLIWRVFVMIMNLTNKKS